MEDNIEYKAIEEIRELAKKSGPLKKINGTTLKILKMSKSRRKEFYESIAFVKSKFSASETTQHYLLQEGVLSYLDINETKITFTFKGLAVLEYKLSLSEASKFKMLEDLNNSYFKDVITQAGEPLRGEEKAIVITLLGLMLFTPESSLKLSSSNDFHSNIEDFKSCVDKSIGFLCSIGSEYIDNTLDKIWDFNPRGEDNVNAKMARMNDISIKTDNIYHKGYTRSGHFLDIISEGKVNKDKMDLLMRKLFDKGPLTYEQREKFIDLLKELYSERHKFVSTADFDVLASFNCIVRAVRLFSSFTKH